jgi:YesN/AraC family two-component response regulator
VRAVIGRGKSNGRDTTALTTFQLRKELDIMVQLHVVDQEKYYADSIALLTPLTPELLETIRNHWQQHKSDSQSSIPVTLLHGLNSPDPIRQLKVWVYFVIVDGKEKVDPVSEKNIDSIVHKVQMYINANVGSNLSLQTLAGLVYIHPSYLSKIFKIRMGVSITEFVYRARMQKALELLKTTDEKIYRIGIQLGYPNANWFIKLFKRYFRITPQDYRDWDREQNS